VATSPSCLSLGRRDPARADSTGAGSTRAVTHEILCATGAEDDVAEKPRYERSTRECDLRGMDAQLAAAIEDWARGRRQTGLLGDVVAGCETVSTLQGRRGLMLRLMKMPQRTRCGAVLTQKWLVWAVAADERPPTVLGVRLGAVEITDYVSSPNYRVLPDNGLYVKGLIGPTMEPGTIFIGLAEDHDGRAFKERVLGAWKAARD